LHRKALLTRVIHKLESRIRMRRKIFALSPTVSISKALKKAWFQSKTRRGFPAKTGSKPDLLAWLLGWSAFREESKLLCLPFLWLAPGLKLPAVSLLQTVKKLPKATFFC
ncbi:MAG TPA: hypothetical protein VJS44_07860, partial [Pyrinomonadaceae bacterium]|nr:hypothetical protein [Pyrinomonadaceae bacterium]